MTKEERIQELREQMTLLSAECYSQELSACPIHPIFQPQKFINLILALIKSSCYLKAERELSESKYREEAIDSWAVQKVTHAYLKDQAIIEYRNQMLTPDSEGRVWASVYKWE